MRQSANIAPSRQILLAGLMHDLVPLLASLGEHLEHAEREQAFGRLAAVPTRTALNRHREVADLVQDVLALLAPGGGATPEPFDAIAGIEHAIGIHAERASGSKVVLHVDVRDRIRVHGRRSLLTRAVGNLVRNAIRYARGEIRVEVTAPADDAVLRIVVEDDGPGIDPALAESLFEAGARGPGAGHGLGLAIAQWAITALGGSVALAAPSRLGGARFELLVPGSWAAPTRREAMEARPFAGRVIALVDDDGSVRNVIRRVLERGGARAAEIDPAGQEWESIGAELRRAEPDLILLDQRLGSRKGSDLHDWLRRSMPELAARVAYFSGQLDWDDETPDPAAPPVIPKGIGMAELQDAVAAAIQAFDKNA